MSPSDLCGAMSRHGYNKENLDTALEVEPCSFLEKLLSGASVCKACALEIFIDRAS